MSRNYKQGLYIPKNPEKYVGDKNNIFYRSGWELKFMKWADANPSVLHWNNEELVVPYISPEDNCKHRYFVDFVVMVKTKNGEIKKYAVEIKPESQTLPPSNRKKTKKYLAEVKTYLINTAKWKAAHNFCEKNGLEFVILTEKHLF
jgi:TnsA endonuclease N terminal